MTNIDTAKRNARVLKAFLKEHNIALAHGLALEATARIAGHRNWATLLATDATEARLSPTLAAVQAWPSYVFFLYEDEDTLEEALYFLPKGATLSDDNQFDRFGAVCTDHKIMAPESFLLDSDTVVTDVHSFIPRVDKYGLPWYANDDLAARFFRESLGCAAIDTLSVTLRETGDDSAAQYWFEARVNPSLVHLLEQAEADKVPSV
jgi:hypothetical protein